MTPNITTLDKVKRVETVLKECNDKAKYKFKVRRTKEQYNSKKLYCLTIVGKVHIEFLEQDIVEAIQEFFRVNNYEGQIQHTSQHNFKMYFPK